jgi:competence ComEA-like helix-hairpin-helix protein
MPAFVQWGAGRFVDCRVVQRLCIVALLVVIGILSAAAQKHPPEHPIDLNTATREQLQQLPAVGQSIAKSIVEFRERSGPFRRVDDLLAIRGITKQRLEKIRPYVVVNVSTKSQ